jgi:GMP synthase (glutamine-hydrolysing)
MLRPVLILHTGDPAAPLEARHGHYGEQLRRAAGLAPEDAAVVSVHRGQTPLAPSAYRAALVTGSPAMVTDREPWSEATAEWLRNAVAVGLPIFGVCYGHQLLSHALGGEVGYLPASELGTQEVERVTAGADEDPLAASLPARFPAQMLHAQTVLRPPAGAAVLARSEQDPHQFLRLAQGVYSSQFHPEFEPGFVREHLLHHAAHYQNKGHDPQALAADVQPTPDAASLLIRFLELHAPRR